MSTLATRFWARVRKGEACWEWTGALRGGYGCIAIRTPRGWHGAGAHRVSLKLDGRDVADDACVLHHCDNRRCVRPSHLYVGTRADNARDAVARDRIAKGSRHGTKTRPDARPRGERNGNARLKAHDIDRIRASYRAGGVTKSALAREYGISKTHAGHIVAGKRWS